MGCEEGGLVEMFTRWYQWQQHYSTGDIPALEGMAFVDVSNAARYFHEKERELWDISKDFPTLILPWSTAWMEYKMPKYTRGDDGTLTPINLWDVYMGAVATSIEIKPEKRRDAIKYDLGSRLFLEQLGEQAFPQMRDMVSGPSAMVYGRAHEARFRKAADLQLEARWLQTFDLLMAQGKEVRPWCHVMMYLDPSGRAIKDLVSVIPLEPDMMDAATHGAQTGSSGILPFCYAVSLLNCKNVTLEPAQYNRAITRRAKHRGVPDVVFKELHVKPMGQRNPDPKHSGADSYQKQRLHICRGHFKDYRNGGGLFGRYKGLYWWSQQLRGDIDQGVVIKDYVVEAVD